MCQLYYLFPRTGKIIFAGSMKLVRLLNENYKTPRQKVILLRFGSSLSYDLLTSVYIAASYLIHIQIIKFTKKQVS